MDANPNMTLTATVEHDGYQVRLRSPGSRGSVAIVGSPSEVARELRRLADTLDDLSPTPTT